MATTRLVYLVRHGRTALNAEGRLRGRLDPGLDHVGLEQARRLGLAFASLAIRPIRITAGPLARTVETAATIASSCGLEFDVEPRLVDRDYGPWTGASVADVRARFGTELADLPDAEPLNAITARTRAVLEEQADYLSLGPAVLVAHDVVNKLLLHDLDRGLGPAHTIEQRTAGWNSIGLTDSGWHVLVVNGDADTLRNGPDQTSRRSDE
jgi:broad specificity phosphatase PhoE